MTISLVAVVLRHERRARCIFSSNVAAGAFISTAYYSVTNADGNALSPDVVAALAVANSPNVVELQLGHDLTPGCAYDIAAVGVPGADATVTPAPSTLRATFGQPANAPGAAAVVARTDRILYGADIAYAGGEFREDARGDLAEVAGLACLEADMQSLLDSNGLPWAPDYGLQARRYVDGPGPILAELRGRAESQARNDDRIADARAAVTAADQVSDADEAASTVSLTVTPVGATDVASKTIHVSTQVS